MKPFFFDIHYKFINLIISLQAPIFYEPNVLANHDADEPIDYSNKPGPSGLQIFKEEPALNLDSDDDD